MSSLEISRLEHCTDRQLRDLLDLAYSNAKSTKDWLLEVGDVDRMEALLTEMYAASGQIAGAMLQAVCAAETPIENLMAIKGTAKRLAVAAQGPAQHAAATLLYHLSIAAALGQHGRNISSKRAAEQMELYSELAGQLSDEELVRVFEKAASRLRGTEPALRS